MELHIWIEDPKLGFTDEFALLQSIAARAAENTYDATHLNISWEVTED